MGKKSQPEPQVIRYALSTGEIAILPTESQDDLHQLINGLTEQNEPNTPAEQFLVDQMIHARWNLLRFRRLEAVAFDRIVEEPHLYPRNTDRRLLNTIEKPGNILDKLQKMAAAAERAYARAVRDLAQLRAKAQKSEKQNKANAADEWLQAELAKLENEPIDDPYIRFGTTQPPDSSRPEPATHDPVPFDDAA